MFYVEFPKEVGIDFDGGFEYEYLPNSRVKVTPISPNGKTTRVSKQIYRQMCDHARSCLKGWQEIIDEQMATNKY